MPLFIFADDNILNIYIWSNEIPPSVIDLFERETGIDVHVSYFGSNEELYAKMRATGNPGYDIIQPSGYFVGRMAKQEMLLKLDKSQLPNIKNVDPFFVKASYDPNEQYSIPIVWGTTGIFINRRYFPNVKIDSWNDLWSPQFKDTLLLPNDPGEVFVMAMFSMHESIIDPTPETLKAAYEKLITLLPNVRLFNSEAAPSIVGDEDATVGIMWNSDFVLASQSNTHLQFIYPKEGFLAWVDCLTIPTGAKHLQNAYRFLNFILRGGGR